MNDTIRNFITLICGIGFFWCLKILLFPKTANVEQGDIGKEVIVVKEIGHLQQGTRNQEIDTAKPLQGAQGALEEEIILGDTAMSKYQNSKIQDFWIGYCVNLQEPYRAVIWDVLNAFDNSMEQQTECQIQKATPKKNSANNYDDFKVLQQVPYWRHMIDIGETYIGGRPIKERSGPLFCLGLLACLGHDLGKLPQYSKKYSCAVDDAVQGAQVMKVIINGRIHEANEKELLDAIKRHHLNGGRETPPLTRLLQTAHAKALDRERHQAIVNHSAER